MKAKEASNERELTAAVVTDAAAWVARLHSPLRDDAVERGFRSWLTESADHARAFELVTDSWDEVATLRSAANFDITLPSDVPFSSPFAYRGSPHPLSRSRPGRGMFERTKWLALAAALSIAVVSALFYFWSSPVTTGVGEQRLLSLDDGTRVYMNTLTRVSVDYSKQKRRVRLESGEALFDVAQQANRPFVVSAGNREVLALGTSFVVRRDREKVSVTLVDGKVSVEELDLRSLNSPDPPAVAVTVLTPGERITFVRSTRLARIDRPVLEKVTAWQRGKVPIENLSLIDAVAEMNRYSKVQLSIERPEARDLRVSGIFRVGDSLSFARAVSQSYGLQIEEGENRIVLAGMPQ